MTAVMFNNEVITVFSAFYSRREEKRRTMLKNKKKEQKVPTDAKTLFSKAQ
jgi:hypothetical protein